MDAIIQSTAKHKLVLLNEADLKRNGGSGQRLADKLWQAAVGSNNAMIVTILGGKDYNLGINHHKVCVIDKKVVWFGSFNFTWQAQKNYENLVRIEDKTIAGSFHNELTDLSSDDEVALWDRSIKPSRNARVFRCKECSRIIPSTKRGQHLQNLCIVCEGRLQDRR